MIVLAMRGRKQGGERAGRGDKEAVKGTELLSAHSAGAPSVYLWHAFSPGR